MLTCNFDLTTFLLHLIAFKQVQTPFCRDSICICVDSVFLATLTARLVTKLIFFSRELNDTLGQLKESKKVYKRKINEVESGATTTTNNDVEDDDDIYVLYKATKYKIKLIKALIEKQNNSG